MFKHTPLTGEARLLSFEIRQPPSAYDREPERRPSAERPREGVGIYQQWQERRKQLESLTERAQAVARGLTERKNRPGAEWTACMDDIDFRTGYATIMRRHNEVSRVLESAQRMMENYERTIGALRRLLEDYERRAGIVRPREAQPSPPSTTETAAEPTSTLEPVTEDPGVVEQRRAMLGRARRYLSEHPDLMEQWSRGAGGSRRPLIKLPEAPLVHRTGRRLTERELGVAQNEALERAALAKVLRMQNPSITDLEIERVLGESLSYREEGAVSVPEEGTPRPGSVSRTPERPAPRPTPAREEGQRATARAPASAPERAVEVTLRDIAQILSRDPEARRIFENLRRQLDSNTLTLPYCRAADEYARSILRTNGVSDRDMNRLAPRISPSNLVPLSRFVDMVLASPTVPGGRTGGIASVPPERVTPPTVPSAAPPAAVPERPSPPAAAPAPRAGPPPIPPRQPTARGRGTPRPPAVPAPPSAPPATPAVPPAPSRTPAPSPRAAPPPLPPRPPVSRMRGPVRRPAAAPSGAPAGPRPPEAPQGPETPEQKIRRALASPTSADFMHTPLSDVLRSLSNRHGIRIELQESVKAALRAKGLDTNLAVTSRRADIPGVPDILETALLALEEHVREETGVSLVHEVSGGTLWITERIPGREYRPVPEVASWMAERQREIRNALASPTSIDFMETPLSDVVDYLSTQHRIRIELSHRSLNDVGVSPDTPITVCLAGVPLEAILLHIEGMIGLTHVVTRDVLQIRADESAARREYREEPETASWMAEQGIRYERRGDKHFLVFASPQLSNRLTMEVPADLTFALSADGRRFEIMDPSRADAIVCHVREEYMVVPTYDRQEEIWNIGEPVVLWRMKYADEAAYRAALTADPYAYQRSALAVRNNPDIYREAIRRNPVLLADAPPEVLSNLDFVLQVIEGSPFTPSSLRGEAKQVLSQNRDFALRVFASGKQHGVTLNFFSPELRSDPDIVRAAIVHNARNIVFTRGSALNDQEILRFALAHNPDVIVREVASGTLPLMPALVQMMSEEAKPTVWAALAKELGTQWLSDRIQKKKLTEGQVTIEDQEHPQVFLLWGDVPNRRVILYYNPAGGGRVYLLPSGTWQSPRPVSVEGRIRSIKSFGAQRWDIFNEANTPIARVTRGVSAGGEREELRIHRGGTDREEDSVFRRPRPVE